MIFRRCQFIEGEPSGRWFCGAEPLDLGPWCEAHRELVFHTKGGKVWDRMNSAAVNYGGKFGRRSVRR